MTDSSALPLARVTLRILIVLNWAVGAGILVLLIATIVAAQWTLTRAPHLLETSLPGVFAVGDVRGGNIKRVASAVGEGAIAVALVHRVLQA